MTLEEIKASGLLELYIAGQLSPSEKTIVEEALEKYPELKEEYFQLQKSLLSFAYSNRKVAPSGTLNKILNEITTNSLPVAKTINNKLFYLFGGFLILSAIAGYWLYSENKNLQQEFNSFRLNCEKAQKEKEESINIYKNLLINSVQIKMTPTPGYANSSLIFYLNSEDRKNYLKVDQLPEINENEVFQLWSLKQNQQPIPMNLFVDSEDLIELDFADNTLTYAITIEPKEGSKVPNLDKLIGTFSVGE